MQEIDQSLFIDQLEHELENQLKEVLEVFQNLPESKLLRPSSTSGWSIAECFEHLNSYAEFYLPKLRNALNQSNQIQERPIFKHTWLGNYFIRMMDINRSKKKYKAIKKHRPRAIDDPHAVISAFVQHAEDLLQLLKEGRTKDLRKASVVTSISSLIKLNAGDTLLFVLTHNRRHIVQAKRNL